MNEDDIDPAAKPTRRTFSLEYKTEILAKYHVWPKGSEERGAILRREGLYSSHISEWHQQAEAGAREGLARKSKKRRSRDELEKVTSTKQACPLLGANRWTVLRHRRPPVLGPPAPRPAPPNKVTEAARQHVLSVAVTAVPGPGTGAGAGAADR